METTSSRGRADRLRRAAAIVLGYNAPFILWTGYACWKAAGMAGFGFCPLHSWLGWCPACGATQQYADLLREGRAPGLFVSAILCGFALNAAWSLFKATRSTASGTP